METTYYEKNQVKVSGGHLRPKNKALPTCAKPADLYAVRNHLTGNSRGEPYMAAYSEAAQPKRTSLGQYGGSDFLKAVAGKPAEDVWHVLDNLMDTLRVTNAKMYESVMRKLNRI